MNMNINNLMVRSGLTGRNLKLLIATGLLAAFTSGLAWAAQPVDTDGQADVTVYKSEFCGCCTKWAEQLEQSGLDVDVVVVKDTRLIKTQLGVPRELASCHTAVVGKYWVEGHVPVDLVTRLLQEQPKNIKGIAVAGMPPGSPGMEVPNPSAYKVLSVDDSGNVAWYATRMGKSTP